MNCKKKPNSGRFLITRLTLIPGQKGTKKLQKKFGEKLVCIRYRYDPIKKMRYKTAELIVEKEPWKPTPEYWYNPNEIIGIPVEYKEKEIRAKVKSAGGKWNPNRKMWELPYRKICELKLTDRVKPP